ncbi:synaptotagmin-like protein 3 [Mustelus asterias]
MALEIDIKSLKDLECEKVLEVLHRDEMLHKVEQERIRKLKLEYQEIRRKGAKVSSREYSIRSCARCQTTLGLVFNVGVVCSICSHKVCSQCCVYKINGAWRCTVCHAHRQMKVKTGEWFIEERAKKFHQEQGKHETMSEKLLQTFRILRKLGSTVNCEDANVKLQKDIDKLVESTEVTMKFNEGKHLKGFTRSMENLFWSLTGHIRLFVEAASMDYRVSDFQKTLSKVLPRSIQVTLGSSRIKIKAHQKARTAEQKGNQLADAAAKAAAGEALPQVAAITTPPTEHRT